MVYRPELVLVPSVRLVSPILRLADGAGGAGLTFTVKRASVHSQWDRASTRYVWLPPGSYFVSVLAYSSAIEHALGGMLITGADPNNDPSVGIGSRSVPGLEGVQIDSGHGGTNH